MQRSSLNQQAAPEPPECRRVRPKARRQGNNTTKPDKPHSGQREGKAKAGIISTRLNRLCNRRKLLCNKEKQVSLVRKSLTKVKKSLP